MAYTNEADLDNEIQNLADLVPDGKVQATWISAQISVGDKEIDGRLGNLYSVPFSPTPDLIAVISLDLAAYRILRPNYVKEDPAVSDWVDEYRKHAEMLLEKMEEGGIILPGATELGVVQSTTESRNRVFTQTTYDTDDAVIEVGSLEDI